jgi:phosphoribosylformimino-5-aminoimidazole carboxamide ribotide isomerase
VTRFRPCIDLHQGRVKQIVGGTLTDSGARENFVSELPATHYADLYQRDGLAGGHVIQLGAGNGEAARAALSVFPLGLQLGGGVTPDSARQWLDAGASHVIVTSYLFDGQRFDAARLARMLEVVPRENLVIDLSCRRVGDGWHVATNRWQTVTDTAVDEGLLRDLAQHCAEFLVHAADVEGLCQGIDEDLVRLLGDASPLPVTYAGGANDITDLERVERLSGGRVDLTFGSALDVFGGTLVRYADCVAWNRTRDDTPARSTEPTSR